MRFQVSRTTRYEGRPCDEAVEGTVEVWDRRSFKTPEEHDEKIPRGPGWLEAGTDHGIWRRGELYGIERRMPDRQAWFVDIETLEDLVAFMDKHGDLVLQRDHPNLPPEIEIYDDYRE